MILVPFCMTKSSSEVLLVGLLLHLCTAEAPRLRCIHLAADIRRTSTEIHSMPRRQLRWVHHRSIQAQAGLLVTFRSSHLLVQEPSERNSNSSVWRQTSFRLQAHPLVQLLATLHAIAGRMPCKRKQPTQCPSSSRQVARSATVCRTWALSASMRGTHLNRGSSLLDLELALRNLLRHHRGVLHVSLFVGRRYFRRFLWARASRRRMHRTAAVHRRHSNRFSPSATSSYREHPKRSAKWTERVRASTHPKRML